jgi:HD-GYP domain-containing protein (c-di-GMP phosphodiesterase class II)
MPRTELYSHTDPLDILNKSIPLDEKLAAIHESLYGELEFIDRISVAAYDQPTDMLRTFLASSPGSNDLVRYEARLADSPSLGEILKSGKSRVVNDLEIFRRGAKVHSAVLAEEGFKSSYTVPMYLDGSFWGFIFFNSRMRDVFHEEQLRTLDIYAHLISTVVTAEMLAIRILAAAVKTALDMAHYRDPETGDHMERMSRYARLIAQHLAATGVADLDDATIERIFQFAPLHDLGKIAVPDRVLLKQGKLSPAERDEMKQHTVRGRAMIESIAHNFGLEQLDGFDMLRHIAESHHENMDGSGYPHGLRGEEIPLEARIVAVADVFDALTSTRPYKATWSNDEAFAWLRKLARTKFDENCVEALIFNAHKVVEIQAAFKEHAAEMLPS